MDLNLTMEQLEVIDLALFYRERALIYQRAFTDDAKKRKELLKDIQEHRATSRAIADIRYRLTHPHSKDN